MIDAMDSTDKGTIEKLGDWLVELRLRWVFALVIAATLLITGIAIGFVFAVFTVFGVNTDASPDQVTCISEMMSDRGAILYEIRPLG